MTHRHLAGIDIGTTGTRCAIFGLDGRRLSSAYREYGAAYPHPGWVEQDLDHILTCAAEASRAAVASAAVDPTSIAAIGFSTQRSVTCLVDAAGALVRPMISWQDARTGDAVAAMRRAVDPEEYYATSGLPLGTTWILTKILWMREHEPELWARTRRVVQNQDLALRAFGAEGWHTDLSDMAFYGAWDVRRAAWSPDLLGRFGLEAGLFGTPTRSGTAVGAVTPAVAARTGFAPGTAVCVGAGDQNCAVIGMGAITQGMATVTLGTAGLAILATDRPVPGFGGMMVTNHVLPGMWEVEGLSNAAAAAYRWFRDVIGTAELERERAGGPNAYEALNGLVAQTPPGARGLVFLPYLATAGTPRWDPQARAAFIGMSLAHGRPELARAVMEGVALEIRDMIERWRGQGMTVDLLRIGGGATRSRLWNQIQADIYGCPVQTLEESETTVLGAAILAGVGAGLFASVPEGVTAMVRVRERIDPQPANQACYGDLYAAFIKSYEGLAGSGAFAALAGMQR